MSVSKVLPYFSELHAKWLPKCGSVHCRTRSRFYYAGRRLDSIRIGKDWYCSPECFESASQERIARLCTGKILARPQRRPRMSLGLTMLSLGHITAEQLQSAIDHQASEGGRTGEVLVALNFATAAQVTSGLASQWGCPVLSLKGQSLQVPMQIPVRLMELYSVLPIRYIERTNTLALGFVESIEHRMISAVEAMFHCHVIPCFITREDFENGLAIVSLEQRNEEVTFEHIGSIPEIARITGSYALQTHANVASFGLYCDYIWSRLSGGRFAVDILSRVPEGVPS